MPGRRHRRGGGGSSASVGGSAERGSGNSQASAAGSNADQAAKLRQGGGGSLDSILDRVIAGDHAGAKADAHARAEDARGSGDVKTATSAGLAWQVANGFQQGEAAVADTNFDAAKNHLAGAANAARALQATGQVSADAISIVVDSAGKAWGAANLAAQKQAEAKKQGSDVPMIDQHELDHWNNGAFCGIATMIMMLKAAGVNQGTSNADLNALADRVYTPGKGSSGALMARVLNEKGAENAGFTTGGSVNSMVKALDKGKQVPFGVVLCDGTVTKLEGGSSKRYGGTKVGDAHYHKFGASGHWVLVTGYEGKPEAPTAFYVNDPDLGGEMKCTPDQIIRMGAGNGAFWMIGQ